MKLVRYGALGQEKPGLLDHDGQLRDLSGEVADVTPDVLSKESLKTLAGLEAASLPLVPGSPRLGVPVAGVRKFLAIGLNYSDHAAESGADLPKEPILFTKAITCLQGANDPVVLPPGSTMSDWEVELGVVIGTRCSYVDPVEAIDYVAGYVLVNDVSEREYQHHRGGSWDKGKGCDTFGPVGPWIVTADEVGDPQNVALWLELNGVRYQNGNTTNMIFDVKTVVSYVSQFMTLEPGDIITTGTPAGVGAGIKPNPVFLKEGDEMVLGSDKLGNQRQDVIRHPGK